eukprot:2397886-Pleurochrysis_carterae.AAC.1
MQVLTKARGNASKASVKVCKFELWALEVVFPLRVTNTKESVLDKLRRPSPHYLTCHCPHLERPPAASLWRQAQR